MLNDDPIAASDLIDEMQETRQLLESEGDVDSSRFLKVLQVRNWRKNLGLAMLYSAVTSTLAICCHSNAMLGSRHGRHRFLQGMLKHTLLMEATSLQGVHATAFNRLCNQVRPWARQHMQ